MAIESNARRVVVLVSGDPNYLDARAVYAVDPLAAGYTGARRLEQVAASPGNEAYWRVRVVAAPGDARLVYFVDSAGNTVAAPAPG